MTEENGTLNDAVIDAGERDSSTPDVMETIFEPSEEEPQEEPKEEEPQQEPDEEPKEEKDDYTRFDKHPRFQELIQKNREYESKLSALEKKLAEADQPKEKPEYNDINTAENDEILEQFSNDPKGFLANFAKQVRSEVLAEADKVYTAREEQQKAQSQQQQLEKAYAEYSKSHPDFEKRWESGEITRLMEENPYLYSTPIAADMYLEREQAIKEAKEAAVKEAKEQAAKELRAKQQAKTLGSGPATSPNPSKIPPELLNPDKFGGDISVLAQRHRARRSAG